MSQWWGAVFNPNWTVSLLPGNATRWEQAVEGVDADLVARDPDGLIPASRSDVGAPLAWLPYLAEERSVDEFTSAWPESRQRAVTVGSFDLHQVKGTRAALDKALTPLGYQLSVREWFDPVAPFDPYLFRIKVDLGVHPWLLKDRQTLIRVANAAKNAHSKLEAIEQVRRVAGTVYIGGVPTRRRTLYVGPIPRPSTIRATLHVFIAAVQTRRRRLVIGPRS